VRPKQVELTRRSLNASNISRTISGGRFGSAALFGFGAWSNQYTFGSLVLETILPAEISAAVISFKLSAPLLEASSLLAILLSWGPFADVEFGGDAMIEFRCRNTFA